MSAWKPCDIRGVYPDEVNEDLLYNAALAIGGALPKDGRVLVAGDYRASTPALKQAVTKGLVEMRCNVLDIGQTATPVAYFAQRFFGTDAVVIVTASHNPPSHNGLKFMLGNLPPSEEQIAALQNAAVLKRSRRGTVAFRNASESYTAWIIDRFQQLCEAASLTVVLDAGNGAWSELAPRIFTSLGFAVVPLFCKVDGSFPNRIPDSAQPKALSALSRTVVERNADLGIAWDGDGDRVAFVDSTGSIVSPDEVSLLLIRGLLRESGGERVVYDLKLSDVIRGCVEAMGGTAMIERSGHTFLKRRMILDNCAFGCEASGHYFYRELKGGDDGLFTALLLCGIVQQQGALLELRRALPNMYLTPDIRLPVGLLTFAETRDRVRGAFPSADVLTIDGLRLATKEGSVLVRPSVTESAFTLRLEGVSKHALEHLLARCVEVLPEFANTLKMKEGL